jgi:hypothetical protein
MTLISLTDCCRLLTIDPKTLRRWLDLACVPMLPHPTDARIKGISASHLARSPPPIAACWFLFQR